MCSAQANVCFVPKADIHRRGYFARFHTNSSVTPAGVGGFVNFISSAVMDEIMRRWLVRREAPQLYSLSVLRQNVWRRVMMRYAPF